MIFMFDDKIQPIIKLFEKNNLPIPQYLHTTIKGKMITGEIIMSWPDKNIIIFDEPISNEDKTICDLKDWKPYCVYDIDISELKNNLFNNNDTPTS